MNCTISMNQEETLANRLLESTTQTLEMYSIYLGARLGLYTALRQLGAASAVTLAHAAGIGIRYAAEWLEQQAVAGFLTAEDREAPRDQRLYTLPGAHAAVLCDEDNGSYLAPLAQMIAGIGAALPEVAAAYKDGRGVPFRWYGEDLRHGQAAINRPAFLHDLPRQWLPDIPEIHSLLVDGSGIRVADLGCGLGWSTIGVAGAYPGVEVVGFDSDEASIVDARKIAAARGSRARFECCDATKMASYGPFHLVLILEALHDMAQPTKVLAAVKGALAAGGSVLIADERVAEEFSAPGDDIERLMYGWSLVHCLPSALCEHPSEAIGTAIRPSTVRSIAAAAGFAHFEILPFSTQFFRFYRLRA